MNTLLAMLRVIKLLIYGIVGLGVFILIEVYMGISIIDEINKRDIPTFWKMSWSVLTGIVCGIVIIYTLFKYIVQIFWRSIVATIKDIFL